MHRCNQELGLEPGGSDGQGALDIFEVASRAEIWISVAALIIVVINEWKIIIQSQLLIHSCLHI